MESNTILKYIAVWGWQIISIIFLSTLIVLMSIPRTVFTMVLSIAFFIVFTFSQYMVFKRRKEFESDK